MKSYNPAQIVSAEFTDFRKAVQFYYQKYKPRTFWTREVQEGFRIYLVYDPEPVNPDRWGIVLKGGIVMWKPRVEIKYSDQTLKEVVFDSSTEAIEYYNKLKSEHKLIDL